jgi:hypothetical protein
MQLLCVHVERFGFEARNPGPDVDTAAGQREAELSSAVVVFVAVEAGDSSYIETTASEARRVIDVVTEQLNTDRIGLVPCRQLTDSPAARAQVDAVLDGLAATLDQFTVARVPLGWDVAYDIETKAHPHAVQHYRIAPAVDTDDGEWLLYRDGTVGEFSPESLDSDTAALLEWERGESNAVDPEYATAGSRLGLFDIGDDGGAFLRPRGVLARDLLEAHVSEAVAEYGAVPVERLGAGDRSVFHYYDSTAALPVRLFEPTSDHEGLSDEDGQLPASTVPALSALVADLPAAFAEACEQAALVHRLLTSLDLSYEPVLRVRGDCLERHGQQIGTLAATLGRPMLVERRPTADWLLKIDFHTPADGQPVTTPTVLIDDSGVEGLALDGVAPIVVRSLPAGAIERTLGAVLAGTEPAQLPVRLAPVQLRLVPIDPADHLAYCEQLADTFETASIRVDIDDRDIAVRERLAAADEAGIPYYTVVGDDERDSDQLGVIDRRAQSEREYSPDELRAVLTVESPDRHGGIRLPRYVSEY